MAGSLTVIVHAAQAESTISPNPAQPAADAVVPPTPSGNPHACGNDWYPPAALAAGEEGTVRLGFRIGTDGSTKNFSVVNSSGYDDLDQAAIRCASSWKYNPATQSGQAVEIAWKADVKWTMEVKEETVVVTRGSTPPSQSSLDEMRQEPIGDQTCKNPSAPPAPLGKKTVVAFVITAGGKVENIRLVASSGDDKLDEYAFACVAKWHYTERQSHYRDRTMMMVPIFW